MGRSTPSPEVKAQDRRPGLPPPQLRLSTFLWVVAVLCGLFAVQGIAGPYVAFALTLLVLAVFAHVAGNAVGTRLRDGHRSPASQSRTPSPPAHHPLDEEDFAPTTQLGQRRSLGWVVIIVTGLGVALGGLAGGIALTIWNWERISIPGVVFAFLFTAVLGGFAGFMASSFVRVFVGAHFQALRHSKRRPPLTPP